MKTLNIYLLLCVGLTVVSCQSSRTPAKYFKRSIFKTCYTTFEPGFMMCNGVKKSIPPKMEIPETQDDYLDASDYYEDKEYRLYLCLKYMNCK